MSVKEDLKCRVMFNILQQSVYTPGYDDVVIVGKESPGN